jgi:hypothetical protein
MSREFTVQVRRSLTFYGAIVVIVAASGIWRVMADSELSITVGILVVFAAWVIMVVFACADLFGYYWSGRDMLLLLAPWPRGAVLAGKATIHGFWFLAVFCVSWFLPFPLDSYGNRVGIGAAAAVVGARALGIIAFFCLLSLLLRATKPLRRPPVAIGVGIFGYLAVTYLGAWVLISATGANDPGSFWALGFGSDLTQQAQYIDVLPIIIGTTGGNSGFDIAGAGVGVNCAIIVVSLGCWLLLRGMRVNFVERR